MVKQVQVQTPAIVFTTAFVAIGTTLLLEEGGAEWIHAVWVVIGVSLLIDLHHHNSLSIRICRLVRKISALVTGLAIGCACGLLVRALNNWDSPRWTVLLLRLLVECLLLVCSAIAAQWTTRVSSVELTLVCLSSSLALFCPKQNLATARVVAMLFACALTLAVLTLFLVAERLGRSGGTKFTDHEVQLIDMAMTLCAKVLRSDDGDKEEIDRLSCLIRESLDNDMKFRSHLRPLVYECYSMYWSLASCAACTHGNLFSGPSYAGFFRPSIERIEDGLDGVRNDLMSLLSAPDVGTQTRLVEQWIAGNLIEGLQGLEFNFSRKPCNRFFMASYLVNLSSVLVSLIGFVQILLRSIKTAPELDGKLTDCLTRINSFQKLGSYAFLQDMDDAYQSRRGSSAAISPIVARTSFLDHHSQV